MDSSGDRRSSATPSDLMLRRLLRQPFGFPAVLFVAFSTAAVALCMIGPPQAGPLRILPQFILGLWLFRFAYAMLEHLAHGRPQVLVPALEMLGPFSSPRAMVHPVLGAAVLLTLLYRSGVPAAAGWIAVLLFPLSMAAMVAADSVWAAVNPLAWVRALRGLGSWYPAVAAATVAVTALAIHARGAGFWPLWFAVLEFALLALYSLLGSALQARHLALGFEPAQSPERERAAAARDHARRRQQMIDDVYAASRARNLARAEPILQRWLADAADQQLDDDVRCIVGQAVGWPDTRRAGFIAGAAVEQLMQRERLSLALQTMETALQTWPALALQSATGTVILARYARDAGHRHTARQLLKNFESRSAAPIEGVAAGALHRELHDE